MSDFPKKLTDTYNGQKYEAPFALSAEQQQAYNQYMFAKEQYQGLVTFLNTLTVKDAETGELVGYGKNEFGFEKNMDEETLDILRQKCHALNDAGQQLIKQLDQRQATPERDSLLYDINYNTHMARQDANAIENVDSSNIPSYVAMRRDANYTVIDTSDDELGKVGGALSSRIPIRYCDRNGQIRKGFFTQDSVVSSDKLSIDNYSNIKVDKGENINSRNSSMSDMASLLNMENILAHSTEMTIVHDGKEYHGTFMSNAKGEDFNEVLKEGNLISGRTLGVDYNSATKSATDLMVLDYICLNVDRHQNNCFYDIQQDKNGNLVIKGVQGIDNDMSFGKKVPGKNEVVQNMAEITNLKCLHKDTANRIMNLTKESLTATLVATGRTASEIDACWKRTQVIQNRIKSNEIVQKTSFKREDFFGMINRNGGATPAYNMKLLCNKYVEKQEPIMKAYQEERARFLEREVNRLRAAKPEAFKKRGFQDRLVVKLQKIFYNHKKQEYDNIEFNRKVNDGIEGLHNKVRIDSKLAIKQQSKDFDKLFNKLWKPKDKDLPEYHAMYKSMQSVHELLGSFKNKDLAMLSDQERNLLADRFNNLEKDIKAYIPAVSMNPSRNDLKRIGISQGILDVCTRAQEQREQTVNEFNETMAGAFRAVNAANEKKIKAKEFGENSIAYTMANAEFVSKQALAGFLGNLETPTKEDKARLNICLANLTVIEKLSRMEKEEPSRYAEQMESLRKDPNEFTKMVNRLLGEKGFQKIANGIDYRFAIADNVEKGLAVQCDKAHLFKNVIAAESTIEQKVDKEFSAMTAMK